MFYETWKNPGASKRCGVIVHTIDLSIDPPVDHTQALGRARLRREREKQLALREKYNAIGGRQNFQKWLAKQEPKPDTRADELRAKRLAAGFRVFHPKSF